MSVLFAAWWLKGGKGRREGGREEGTESRNRRGTGQASRGEDRGSEGVPIFFQGSAYRPGQRAVLPPKSESSGREEEVER